MTDDGTNHASRDLGNSPEAAPVGDLSFHIKRAEHAIMARKADALRELGLTVPQCMALGLLMAGESKSCTQLAREALVTSQTMTGIVNNLDAKGFIARRTSPDHGRVVLLSLTPDGLAQANRAQRVSGAIERDVRDAFSDSDRALLAQLLNRVAETASGAGTTHPES